MNEEGFYQRGRYLLISSKRKSNPFKNAARLRRIVSVFAKHGFQELAERIKLGRFVLGKMSSKKLDEYSTAEKLRMCFEQLGPTFIKFGQLLATRPDLIPNEFVEEFKKLHDQVPALPFESIERVLNSHFGGDLSDTFSEFDKIPLAAASIAQVYKATLKNGAHVVLKVQRPGIEAIINEDISVIYNLAELLEKYVPEVRPYNPVGVVDEFFKALELETNFIVESNNIKRFHKNFQNDENIKIPLVFEEYSGKKVLVMEALEGIPLSQKNALSQEGIDPEQILKTGLRCYLKMVFSDGLFHGDLHAGNMFVLPNSKIGLIDFGVVGRLNRKTQAAIANMLIALANEDYDRLAYEYVDLAPYSDHVDPDVFARELRDLIAPYYGLTLKNLNVGRLFVESTGIAARNSLILPTELVMFFKSIVTIEGMGRVISADFDFLTYSLEFAAELVQSRYEPGKIMKDISHVGRDMNSLMQTLPRQIKQFLRKVNSPGFSPKLQIHELKEVKKSIETSSNIIFLGFIIGSLILSGSLLVLVNRGPYFLNLPILSLIAYSSAALLGLVAFINYIRK